MEERLRILERIEAGEITAEEGARQLEECLEGQAPKVAVETEVPEAAEIPVIRPKLVEVIWQVVLWVGVAVVVGGALLVASVYAWDVAARWLVCGWPLFALGVVVVALAWWLRGARWLSLRVRQHDGPNISFALPLPLGLIAWGFRIARPFVPDLQDTAVDELILAMQDELREGHPLMVDVDEGEDGEKVQVYIG